MDIACFSSGIVLDSVCPEAVLYISLFTAAYSLVPRLELVFEFLEVYLVYSYWKMKISLGFCGPEVFQPHACVKKATSSLDQNPRIRYKSDISL